MTSSPVQRHNNSASVSNKNQFPTDTHENVDSIPNNPQNTDKRKKKHERDRKIKIYLAIEPHAILLESGTNSNSGGGAEVSRIESDTDTIVNR